MTRPGRGRPVRRGPSSPHAENVFLRTSHKADTGLAVTRDDSALRRWVSERRFPRTSIRHRRPPGQLPFVPEPWPTALWT